MKINLILTLFMFSTSLHAMDYINKYLPEDSVIRKKHNSEPRKTGWFGFNSSVRSACDGLNSTYAHIVSIQGLHHTDAFLHLYRNAEIILDNQDNKTKQTEQEWVSEIQNHLERMREAKIKEQDESLKRRATIRAALEKIDSSK